MSVVINNCLHFLSFIFRLGCSRMAISGFITAEIFIIGFFSIAVSAVMLFIARSYSDILIKYLIM